MTFNVQWIDMLEEKIVRCKQERRRNEQHSEFGNR